MLIRVCYIARSVLVQAALCRVSSFVMDIWWRLARINELRLHSAGAKFDPMRVFTSANRVVTTWLMVGNTSGIREDRRLKPAKLAKIRCLISLVVIAMLACSQAWAAGASDISGSWTLNKDDSEKLEKQLDKLKLEIRDYAYDHGKISDPDKPDPFENRRKVGDKEWETRRNGGVVNPSVIVRHMVEAKSLKVHISERIIVAYDGKVRRRINPNPNGRVHSAKGKGTSKDTVGTTMAYLDADAVVIETLTNSAERLVERLEISRGNQLKLTTVLHNPQWKHSVTFVRMYDRTSR
ncbi:MAG: hypothetical protein ACI9BW_004495 [Gammaproteobacteria bacterium]|jgi:hypothetical protein